MRVVFDYLISNFSNKPLGPVNLDDLLGSYDRELNTVFIAADGYISSKGVDVVPWETVIRKFAALVSTSDIPDHLVSISREINKKETDALNPIQELPTPEKKLSAEDTAPERAEPEVKN